MTTFVYTPSFSYLVIMKKLTLGGKSGCTILTPPPQKKMFSVFLLGVPYLPPDLCYTEGETLDELLCSLEELNKREVQMTKNNIYIKAKTLNSGGI